MTKEVTVVGGGAIGLASAYYLAQAGAAVRVVEARRVGSGASWGNSGWIAPSFAAPIPAKGLLGYTLRSLTDPASPIYFALRADADFTRWAWRFWRHCNDSAFQRGMRATARLGENTHALYAELAAGGIDFGIQRAGILMVARQAEALAGDLDRLRILSAYGYPLPEAILTGDDLHKAEPVLSDEVTAGFLIEGEAHVDPARISRGFADALDAEILEGTEVAGIDHRNGRATALRTSSGRFEVENVVLAAGAWTEPLARMLGVKLLMQAGKGYSFSIRPRIQPRRPIHFGESKVVVTPLSDGKARVSGTMELSGLNLRLDERRIRAIKAGARRYLADWPGDTVEDEWVGMRPLAADGLPILGRVPGFENVYLATGHSMSGITLAPATGLYMSELIMTGHTPGVLKPFDPGRVMRR
ncbi:FAD-binding oxidoreductase [Kribbella capetownensis]|uniref:FAD-binding oxidoreductase n=1 Tax=Kribbella capetownensis TaxID=1572659 RepID=A0A4R0JYD8_9ACTN|nr:FAD-dependent oxidoreductase [Kribbella capetownensis]TCC51274.1 FAD-binding oxidoreductase [Kribbella capetownensis]